MSKGRNALGRGLGALIPGPAADTVDKRPQEARTATPLGRTSDAPANVQGRDEPASEPGPQQISVDAISPNPEQPRRHFDPAQLASLSESIRQHGVLQPVVVRRVGERYELIVGERRWRATRAAGLATIPAVVSDIQDQKLLELAIIENVQRHDLNPMELAHAYRALAEAGATQEEIGQRVSKDRSSVANHLRLLELSREIQEDLERGRISMGHAKALLQVGNPERRRHLRDRVVSEALSVRETERLGRGIAGPAPGRRAKPARTPVDPSIASLVEALEKQLQTKVRIKGEEGRGRIEIEYFEPTDLDRIARILLEGV